MEKLIVLVWILFGFYILVFVMILADLWSGISKARKSGVIRSSFGFRRTVEKTARYYNALFALSVVDTMQIACIWYLETYYNKSIPMFPFISLIGALGICAIEIKSIYEKAEDKVRIDDVGQLIGKIVANKDNLQEVAKSISEYMKAQPEVAEELEHIKEKEELKP